jgi:hypothetical protein
MRPRTWNPSLNDTARNLYDTAEAFSKTIIGSQFLEMDTIAKTNTYVSITYLLENINNKGELQQKKVGYRTEYLGVFETIC